MMKKIWVILFLFLFTFQVASAIDTEIKLKVPTFTEVHLSILNPSTTGYTYMTYKETSNAYGDVVFNHSGDELVFDLGVVLKQSGKRIHGETFESNYKAGETINLEVIPEGYDLVETPESLSTTNSNSTNSTGELNETNSIETNSTEENNEETEENTVEEEIPEENTESSEDEIEPAKKSGILGFSISDGGGFFSLKTLYYIIGVILLFGIAFFVLRFMRTQQTPKIKVKKLSDVKSPEEKQPQEKLGTGEAIRAAEEKIKKAQEEINALKKEQRIQEIKERIKKEQKELDDLS